MAESGTMYEPIDISDAFVQVNLDTTTTIRRTPVSSSSIAETVALQEAGRQALHVISDSTVAVHSVTHAPFAATQNFLDEALREAQQNVVDIFADEAADVEVEVAEAAATATDQKEELERIEAENRLDAERLQQIQELVAISLEHAEQSSSTPIDDSWRADGGTTTTPNAEDFDWELWNDLVQHEDAIFSEDRVSEVEMPE